ncbi:MAG: hypothetical protein U1D66_02320 [Erythrobacter sp.]|nr:hypothetical protein [Erythrobacter sp.]
MQVRLNFGCQQENVTRPCLALWWGISPPAFVSYRPNHRSDGQQRADHWFNVGGLSVNLRCRIASHIIPSPQALIVTGVTPAQLVDPALPSLFEFTQTIMELTERWAPSTWVGFNTIRFDEEVLRQAFYQNLLLPD